MSFVQTCGTRALFLVTALGVGIVFSANTAVAQSNVAQEADRLLQQSQEFWEVTRWSNTLCRAAIPFPQVMAAFQQVAAFPTNTVAARKARLEIARVYESMGDTTNALQCYREIAQQMPNTPEGGEATVRIIDSYIENRINDIAIVMVENYANNPAYSNKDGVLLKGVLAAYSVNNFSKARLFCERILREYPESGYAGKVRSVLPLIDRKLGRPATPVANAPPPTPKEIAAEQALAQEQAQVAVQALAAAKEFLAVTNRVSAAIQLQRIVDMRHLHDQELRGEAQYLLAEIHRECRNMKAAFLLYKKIGFDLPKSSWARLAADRLKAKEFQDIEY